MVAKSKSKAVDAYDWDGVADDMAAALSEVYPDLFKLAYLAANADLPVSVSFDLKNPRVKDTIAELAKNIRGVSDSIKESARGVVDSGLDAGHSTQQIAKALREYGVTDSKSRSETIARTETATAYNRGATLAYRDAGVTRVRVLDGDFDEVCAGVDGQEWTLEEADANPIAHPNCTRAFVPIVGGAA